MKGIGEYLSKCNVISNIKLFVYVVFCRDMVLLLRVRRFAICLIAYPFINNLNTSRSVVVNISDK